MTDDAEHAAVRAAFHAAVDGFVELVGAVPAGRLDEPALGEWSVRDLIGHASRALSTIERSCGRDDGGRRLEGPAAYFGVVGAEPVGSEARRQRDESIAERGRESGAGLGETPATAVRLLAERVTALVDRQADGTPVATAWGQLTLGDYLPTRTFELAVHGLDLARALDLPVPGVMGPAIAASTVLAGQVAAAGPDAARVLLALCGRSPLPGGFTVA